MTATIHLHVHVHPPLRDMPPGICPCLETQRRPTIVVKILRVHKILSIYIVLWSSDSVLQ